jgi:hypothetical protein
MATSPTVLARRCTAVTLRDTTLEGGARSRDPTRVIPQYQTYSSSHPQQPKAVAISRRVTFLVCGAPRRSPGDPGKAIGRIVDSRSAGGLARTVRPHDGKETPTASTVDVQGTDARLSSPVPDHPAPAAAGPVAVFALAGSSRARGLPGRKIGPACRSPRRRPTAWPNPRNGPRDNTFIHRRLERRCVQCR